MTPAPRRSGLFAFTAHRPVATTMAVLAVAVFGFISLKKIPLELLPEISYPTITVRTEYPGTGPEDVEERISKKVEETLAVLPGLERHSSISRAGVSDVTLEFQWGTNLSFTTQQIRERLDRTPLPGDAEPPLILRYNPALDPVMRISVYGDADLQEVRRAADEVIARGLASIVGVAAVKVRGGLESEIRIRLDGEKITSLGLDISEVDRRLKIENVNLASGTLIEGDTEYLVRTLNQFQSLDEIRQLAVADRGGQAIRIRDIAVVEPTHKKRDMITRVDGRESVELMVFREADANIVRLARAVQDRLFGSQADQALIAQYESGRLSDPKERLAAALLKAEQEQEQQEGEKKPAKDEGRGQGGREGPGGDSSESPEIGGLRAEVARLREASDFLASRLPRGMHARVLSDQSVFISGAIDEVSGSALLGGLLAIIILLLFLKSVPATTIISVSIPVSVVATFAPMFLFGTSLNIMSLGGLALGVGMLVDNSIVVLESIFRCREEGDSFGKAAIRGTSEVGLAVGASTMTTIAVFFPIVFVSGVAGQIFGDQAITVVFSLISSLVVALFFIPMLATFGAGRAGNQEQKVGRKVRRGELLWKLFVPVLLPVRTLAVRGYLDVVRARGTAGRLLLGTALVPVSLTHLLTEVVGRIVLSICMAILFLVILLLTFLRNSLRVLGFPLQWVFDRAFGLVARNYPRVLRTVLNQPVLMLATFLAIGVAAYGAVQVMRRLPQEMLPTVHQGELIAHLYLQVGRPVEATAETLVDVEQEILALEEVRLVASAIGVARDEVADPDEGSHSARILVQLHRSSDPAITEERAMAKMRTLLARQPELTGFRFSRPTLFSIKAPLEVEARGEDLVMLREAASSIASRMRGLASITDVRSTVTRGNPEVRLTFDRERLRRHGLDLEAIANRIRAQVQGVVSTRYSDGDQRIDVRVLADVDSVRALQDMTINRGRAFGLGDTLDQGAEGGGGRSGTASANIRDRTLIPGTTVDLGGGAAIPLRQVARYEVVEGPSEIRRIQGQRAAVVTANTSGFDIGGAVNSLRQVMTAVEREHPSLLCSIGGQGADMDEALGSMRTALILAIFLVYLVMASQFESIVQPLIILVTVPLALVGGLYALYFTWTPLSVVVLIGGIVLAGIVVNNAIVLVDYANQLRERGLSIIDALVEAGKARLRPILMTTLSTVLALLPLAGAFSLIPGVDRLGGGFWHGSELQAPMAITVIGGLTLSTLLTLIVIPAVYRLVVRERSPSSPDQG
ncbi:MAG: efflux RND transporter permease subunit [Planctomycetota bacterium]